jgi:hypothetical protein
MQRKKTETVTIDYDKILYTPLKRDGAYLFMIDGRRHWVPCVLIQHDEDYKRFTIAKSIARQKGLI